MLNITDNQKNCGYKSTAKGIYKKNFKKGTSGEIKVILGVLDKELFDNTYIYLVGVDYDIPDSTYTLVVLNEKESARLYCRGTIVIKDGIIVYASNPMVERFAEETYKVYALTIPKEPKPVKEKKVKQTDESGKKEKASKSVKEKKPKKPKEKVEEKEPIEIVVEPTFKQDVDDIDEDFGSITVSKDEPKQDIAEVEDADFGETSAFTVNNINNDDSSNEVDIDLG